MIIQIWNGLSLNEKDLNIPVPSSLNDPRLAHPPNLSLELHWRT